MRRAKAPKPATADTVNGLRGTGQLGRLECSQTNPNQGLSQDMGGFNRFSLKRLKANAKMPAVIGQRVAEQQARRLAVAAGVDVSVPPAGEVFVSEHWDACEGTLFWAINHQSQSGDTGWQSFVRFYSPEAAHDAAAVLAEFLGARLR